MSVEIALKRITNGGFSEEETAAKNAMRVASQAYLAHPDLDTQKEDYFLDVCIHPDKKEEHIKVEFLNSKFVHTFTCYDNGKIHYNQYKRGPDSNVISDADEDFESMTDKQILARIKRRRMGKDRSVLSR